MREIYNGRCLCINPPNIKIARRVILCNFLKKCFDVRKDKLRVFHIIDTEASLLSATGMILCMFYACFKFLLYPLLYGNV